MPETKIVQRSFPFWSILGLIFITLKLTGYINWPWVWVLAPFWGPIVVGVALFVIIFLALILFDFFKSK